MPLPNAPARSVVTAIHYTATVYCEEHIVDLRAYLQQTPDLSTRIFGTLTDPTIGAKNYCPYC